MILSICQFYHFVFGLLCSWPLVLMHCGCTWWAGLLAFEFTLKLACAIAYFSEVIHIEGIIGYIMRSFFGIKDGAGTMN